MAEVEEDTLDPKNLWRSAYENEKEARRCAEKAQEMEAKANRLSTRICRQHKHYLDLAQTYRECEEGYLKSAATRRTLAIDQTVIRSLKGKTIACSDLSGQFFAALRLQWVW